MALSCASELKENHKTWKLARSRHAKALKIKYPKSFGPAKSAFLLPYGQSQGVFLGQMANGNNP